MIVIAIIGILAVIAVPSTIRMIERGQQNNRMNIARTIYLAAQNQLTKSYTENNLQATLTEVYFNLGEACCPNHTNLNNLNRVVDRLGDQLSLPVNEDPHFIRFISKPAGILNGAGTHWEWTDPDGVVITSPAAPGEAEFFRLLSEVIIDREILNNAILMEYNIMTGIILSIFYGDGGQVEFVYDNTAEINNILGTRGLNNGYAHAAARRQGFFGVESTGVLDNRLIDGNLREFVFANIFDGADEPLRIGSGAAAQHLTNVLYAEFFIPEPLNPATVYTFTLRGVSASSRPLAIAFNQIGNEFLLAITNAQINNDIPTIFRDTSFSAAELQESLARFGIDTNIDINYNRYIWIIDYISGPGNIVDERADIINIPQFVHAEITNEAGATVRSVTRAHSHFANVTGSRFEVRTVRHLNNIRYMPDGRYRQTADINMLDPFNPFNSVTDFRPIAGAGYNPLTGLSADIHPLLPFSGEYFVMRTTANSNSRYCIINGLSITADGLTGDVGLFRVTAGADIQGLSLFNANIIAPGAANVGAIAGLMTGRIMTGGIVRQSTVSQSFAYANVNGGSGNTGGLVGNIENGLLEESFNAGFANAVIATQTVNGIGSVQAPAGNIGGLVGRNNGTVRNSFNNARVNIADVMLDGPLSHTPTATVLTSPSNLGGIAGSNEDLGRVENTYATNYLPLPPYFLPTSPENIPELLQHYEDSNIGGIVGLENGEMRENFYISNGLLSFEGTAISKEELRGTFRGFTSRFAPSNEYQEGINRYHRFNPNDAAEPAYPYPALRRNNPFNDLIWFWEDIFEIPLGSITFLYYERYRDNSGAVTYGYSEGGVAPLARLDRNRIVENEGYLLEFDDRREMEIIISNSEIPRNLPEDRNGMFSFTLTPIGADGWEWSSNDITGDLPAHIPVRFTQNGDVSPQFRLYFDNRFLESFTNNGLNIHFQVRDSSEEVIYPLTPSLQIRFSPYFADSIGRAGNRLIVRSPRHLSHISRACLFGLAHDINYDFTQEINIDFGLYRKELVMPANGNMNINTSLTLADNNRARWPFTDSGAVYSAVINDVFTGNYTGGEVLTRVYTDGVFDPVKSEWLNYEIRNVIARYGLFNVIGHGAAVERLNIINSQFSNGGSAGDNNAVGSIAAVNHGSIRMSSVQNTTVRGTGTGVRVGGIVGINAPQDDINDTNVSIIEDVFFLSTAEYPGFSIVENNIVLGEGPVSNNGGGIAGFNSGEISRVFYLAPAPKAQEYDEAGRVLIMYPIVRNGASVNNDCIYLRGHRYSRTQGSDWINERYNFSTRPDEPPPPVRTHERAGVGMVTKFIDLDWLNYLSSENILDDMNMSINDMENWYQPSQRYPYPLISGMAVPAFWPEADSPVRPDQEDRDDWEEFRSAADRPRAPTFGNGDFSSPFLYTIPGGNLVDNINIPPYQHIANHWFTADMRIFSGWLTRPVDRSLFNSTHPLYLIPAAADGIGDFRPPYDPVSNPSQVPRWRVIELQTPNGTDDFMRTDYLGRNLARNGITATNNVRTQANGQTQPIRYAELNAESPGTLYQVLDSTPGAVFYYSFYHATNGYPGFNPGSWYTAPPAVGDRLNFYLSAADINEPVEVSNASQAADRDNAMRLIRPCQSPRSEPSVLRGGNSGDRILFSASPTGTPTYGATQRTNINNQANFGTSTAGSAVAPVNFLPNLWLNPAAWNTVAYGASTQGQPTGNASGGRYDLSYHQGREYLQPTGRRVVQNIPTIPNSEELATIYLYDVWIDTRTGNPAITNSTLSNGNITVNANINSTVQGGFRSGYGITFWSTRNLTANNAASSASNIHINGITQTQYNGTAWAWLDDAKTNVIGYWDISYGWKRFYGEYTVPDGQELTEFAFQASTGPTRINVGNYLDGVSFRSPAFLTIDKYIKDSTGNDVMFVKPNDALTIELFVKNHGETVANNIVIRDQLAPFDEYINYEGGTTLSVTKVTPDGTTNGIRTTFNATASYPTTGDNAGTLVITLPANQVLENNEELIIRFPVRVRWTLRSDPDRADTLLYFIRNQGVVEYSSGFLRYNIERNLNGSGPEPVQVFIDPVKLSKTVAPPINGPFEIMLRVEDTTIGNSSINTNGLITDLIPRGFRLVPGVSRRVNHDPGCADCVSGTCPVPWVSADSAIFINNDGSTRMTIGGVNLGNNSGTNIRSIDYRYNIEYIGAGYGVAEIQILSDYKYLYSDEHMMGTDVSVMLIFPKAVIGISVKTQPISFTTSGGGTNVFNITSNDNFAERLADDNYDVMAAVILTDANGEPLPLTSNRYVTDYFTANIVQGTWNLELTPVPGAGGEFVLYYRIMLTATKSGSPDFVLNSPPTPVTITIPSTAVTVTANGLNNLTIGEAVNGSIIYTLVNGTYASTINPAHFAVSGLPAGLLAGAPVRTDTTVTIPITGIPTTVSGSSDVVLPSSIPSSNITGMTADIVPIGTVTAGPVEAAPAP